MSQNPLPPTPPPPPPAPEADPKERDFLIEEWKSTQQSAELFDDLGLRMRTFGIGGVFLIAGYGIKTIKDDQIISAFSLPWLPWIFHLHSSALIVLISVPLLWVVYSIDVGYYSALLLGAVIYAQELERRLRNGREIINEEALREIDATLFPREKSRKKFEGGKTHIYGKTGYISYYTSIVSAGLRTNVEFVYSCVGAILIETFLLLNFPHHAVVAVVGFLVLAILLMYKFGIKSTKTAP